MKMIVIPVVICTLRTEVETSWIKDLRNNQDHSDNSTLKIKWNTNKRPENLKKNANIQFSMEKKPIS